MEKQVLKNCLSVSIELLRKRVLYNGVSADRFTATVEGKAVSTDAGVVGLRTPNIAALAFEQTFYNNAFTYDDYEQQLNETKEYYENSGCFKSKINSANYNIFRINILLGKSN